MFDKWKHRATSDAECPVTVLAITKSADDRVQLQQIFDKAGWKIVFVDGVESGPSERVVLCDRDLPGVDWREAIQQLAGGQNRRGVILASHVVDDYLWEEVIHLGGYDVLAKPFRESDVIHAIEFAWASVTKSLLSEPRTK